MYFLDSSGDPLTGLTDVYVKIMRLSDGYFYDWLDSLFKATVVNANKLLTEISAANHPGMYQVAGGIDTTGFSGAYHIIALQTPGSTAKIPTPEEMRVGGRADDLETVLQFTTGQQVLTEGRAGNLKTYNAAGVLIGTQDVTGKNGEAIELQTGQPANRSKAV